MSHVSRMLLSAQKGGWTGSLQTVGLDEAFLPLWELEEVGEGWAWWRSHLWQRAVFAASVAALLWALSRVAPGTGARPTHERHQSPATAWSARDLQICCVALQLSSWQCVV